MITNGLASLTGSTVASTRTSETAADDGPDLLDRVDALVDDGIDNVNGQIVKEQPIVLVIGETGVGKSTVVRYLHGDRMKRLVNESGNETIVSLDNTTAISDSAISRTLYPEIVPSNSHEFYYCDCPGISDSRGAAYEICGAITTQHVCRVSARVCGVVVVVDYRKIANARSAKLQRVADHLRDVLPDFHKYGNSLLFIVNRIPKKKLEKGNLDQQLQAKLKAHQVTNDELLSEMLKIMLDGQLVCCDPTSESARSGLVEKIDSLNELASDFRVGISSKSKVVAEQSVNEKRKQFREAFVAFSKANTRCVRERMRDTYALRDLQLP